MVVEHTHGDTVYTLTNDGLSVGDRVYPVSRGTCEDGAYAHEEFDFRDFTTGFPDDPHTMLDLAHSPGYKPFECHTSHGFGPVEKYFRVVGTRPLADNETRTDL